ncbi:MAG: 5-formyltetrahydrofolate cyclo-ligase [Acidimicrobiia bacterium]|nr:5-formyltetrahydrofolate cyclo-ligase [Acidimicrobiia bacterium]
MNGSSADRDRLPALRRSAREARRRLGEAERRRADAAIVSAITCVLEDDIGLLASYLADDGEPDLASLHERCHRDAVELAVPVLGIESLTFRSLSPSSTLEVGRLGTTHPVDGASHRVGDFDVVLVPLVVFDEACNRAGRGKGFYDRTLAAVTGGRPLLVGVAYDFQKVPAVPVADHDVALDMVVTDQRTYRRRQSASG